MSSPTPPPAPTPAPARKKPSALASCILLGLILGVLGAVAGGGFWAYKTFVAKPTPKPAQVASNQPKTPAPAVTAPEATPPTTAPAVPTTPPKQTVIESLNTSSTEPKPGTAPTVAAATPPPQPPDPVPTPATPTPAETPATTPNPPATPGTPPATVAATEPKAGAPAQTVAEADAPPPPAEPDPLVVVDPDPVVPAEPIQTFAETDPQVTALKAEADRRIDEAPAELYSDADKQRVRDAIRQSKRLTRVATLQFGAGASALGSNERNRLKKALLAPETEVLLSDPQAVFFLLGFADATGTSDANRRISQKRAASVAEALKGFKVPNSTYAVGIGATTLLSAEKQSRNRATEVWIVLP